MENSTMSAGLKKVIDETKKEIEPLLKQLPKEGQNNYITYYNILGQYKNEDMRKFVAIVLMSCEGVEKVGVIQAMRII
jgi:hypothetical protein